jgi:hypothetical protein
VKKPGVGLAAVSAVLILGGAAAAVTVNGTIAAGDATMTGTRLARNGVTATCVAPKSDPGSGSTATRHYDSYTYVNSSGSGQCVTVTLTQTSGTDTGLFTAAYLGSFDPANPETNYLADPGFSDSLNVATTYSFTLPAGQTAVIVVHEVDPDGCLGCNYTLTYDAVTAVTFASASATRTAKGPLVRWRTGTEADVLGFLVYRSRGQSWRRLSHSLIVAKGSVSGAAYRFLDRTAKVGVSYRYRIKALNRDGTAAWFGPVRVS